jgi:hypothetical protein
MRRTILPLTLIALLALAGLAVAGDAAKPAGKVYGKGVSSNETILISELLAHPETHLGKVVRVEGNVVGVCKARGCWLDIASDKEHQKIQLKVNDGEIVFPPEIMGEKVIVEGTLKGLPMTYDEACSFLEGEAKCQGETFDKTSVPAEGIVLYTIQGTGAVQRPKAS